MKNANDYDQRAGQTAKLIADSEVRSIQILHCLLRSFAQYTIITIHITAGILYWTESKSDKSAIDWEERTPGKNSRENLHQVGLLWLQDKKGSWPQEMLQDVFSVHLSIEHFFA